MTADFNKRITKNMKEQAKALSLIFKPQRARQPELLKP